MKAPYIAYPFFKFCTPPSLLPCFFHWMGDRAISYVLFFTLWHYGSSLGTLVPQGPCGALNATRHQFTEVWHMPWLSAGTLIWYHTHTHTQTHTHTHTQHTNEDTQHTHGQIDWHMHYMLTARVLCSQQLSVLHWMICWYQKFTLLHYRVPQCLCFSKITDL